jgi:hypothetical protein
VTSQIEELGSVTAPTGELVLIDFGCLRLWSGESRPALDPDDVGENVAAIANGAVDLEIVGDNPVAAGRATELAAVIGRYVFDIPADKADEMRAAVESHARDHGFAIQVKPIARMPHRTRVARLLDDSPAGTEVLFGGPGAVAIRGLPADRPLRVRGVRMPAGSPDRERWHSVWVEVDEQSPARTEDIGYVFVDEARLAFATPDALTAWRTDDPVDGLADVAFWGRDAAGLAERTGAGVLDGDTYGWTDLPAQDALRRAGDLYQAKETEGLRFALDLRPHDDHYRLLSLARLAPTESASVEVGGDVVCGFFTSWGDGAFPVRRDLAADGTLCRVRVELGAPEIVERQRKLDDRWFGELSRAALVSNRVAQDGAQVRWMYREASDNPRDSGWRVFSGDESDSEVDDSANITVVPLRDLVAADASLEEFFRTPAPCAFERDPGGDFAAVEYEPPQDLPGASLRRRLRSGRPPPGTRLKAASPRPSGSTAPPRRGGSAAQATGRARTRRSPLPGRARSRRETRPQPC